MKRFRRHLRPVSPMLAAGLAVSAFAALMELAAPWPISFIFDSVIGHRPLPQALSFLPSARGSLLVCLTGGMLAIAALLAGADYLSNRLVATAGQRVVFAIRCELFRHIASQAPSFHHRRQTGDLLARLGGDVQAVQSAMVTAVPTLVGNALTLLGMVTIMLLVDWHYALLTMALVPLLFWMARHYLSRIKALQRRARRADGQAGSVAQEVLTSMTVVQAFGAEDIEASRYARVTGAGLEHNRRAIVAQSEFTPLVTLAMTASTAIVLFFGVRAVSGGHVTVGELIVFMAYLRGMFSPVRQLSKLAGVVSVAHAATERLVEILDTHEEVVEHHLPRRVVRARGAIEMRGVGFTYHGGRRVLDGVDLEIPPGTRQALVGLTGSGKSTLLRLVPRFLDPTTGVVRLDGIDLGELSLSDLRRQIAFVPQEPYLFRATVWENIVYGTMPGGSDATGYRRAAVFAARSAGLGEVIEAFPRGYDTLIGERGSTLSGGQRQCVAVARAMARNAPVLLLDEPTVGLDAELESVLLAALERLAEGRTTIVVSHQLAGLRRADQIAVLHHGRISESGTHEQLIGGHRLYWRLDRLQRGDAPVAPPLEDLVPARPVTKGEA